MSASTASLSAGAVALDKRLMLASVFIAQYVKPAKIRRKFMFYN